MKNLGSLDSEKDDDYDFDDSFDNYDENDKKEGDNEVKAYKVDEEFGENDSTKYDQPDFDFPKEEDFKDEEIPDDQNKYLNMTSGYKNLDLAGNFLLSQKEIFSMIKPSKSCPKDFQDQAKNCQNNVIICNENCDKKYRLCPNQRKEHAVCLGSCKQLQNYCYLKSTLSDTCKVKCKSDQCRKYCVKKCSKCKTVCSCK